MTWVVQVPIKSVVEGLLKDLELSVNYKRKENNHSQSIYLGFDAKYCRITCFYKNLYSFRCQLFGTLREIWNWIVFSFPFSERRHLKVFCSSFDRSRFPYPDWKVQPVNNYRWYNTRFNGYISRQRGCLGYPQINDGRYGSQTPSKLQGNKIKEREFLGSICFRLF